MLILCDNGRFWDPFKIQWVLKWPSKNYLAHNLVLTRETLKHRKTPSWLDLRLFFSGAMFALSELNGIMVSFPNLGDCAENLNTERIVPSKPTVMGSQIVPKIDQVAPRWLHFTFVAVALLRSWNRMLPRHCRNSPRFRFLWCLDLSSPNFEWFPMTPGTASCIQFWYSLEAPHTSLNLSKQLSRICK